MEQISPDELKRRFPGASAATLARNKVAPPAGLRPSEPQPAKGQPLVRPVPREVPSGVRLKIRFVVYSRRPCDWDGYSVKEIQDCLVHAGILDGDDWDRLEGSVRSCKVRKKAEERTEVFIA